MKSETLQLLGTVDETTAMRVASALNAVNGVSKVAVVTASASVKIDFDEDVTSPYELRAVLQQAGVSVMRPVHGEDGMCCGSCGG